MDERSLSWHNPSTVASFIFSCIRHVLPCRIQIEISYSPNQLGRCEISVHERNRHTHTHTHTHTHMTRELFCFFLFLLLCLPAQWIILHAHCYENELQGQYDCTTINLITQSYLSEGEGEHHTPEMLSFVSLSLWSRNHQGAMMIMMMMMMDAQFTSPCMRHKLTRRTVFFFHFFYMSPTLASLDRCIFSSLAHKQHPHLATTCAHKYVWHAARWMSKYFAYNYLSLSTRSLGATRLTRARVLFLSTWIVWMRVCRLSYLPRHRHWHSCHPQLECNHPV